MLNSKRFFIPLLAAGALLAQANSGQAATDQATFQSRITIQADCQILSTNTLDFGTSGIITAAINATADFTVHCTNTTAYNVGLDAGTTTGGSVTTRKMVGNSSTATVDYKMFSDSGRTVNWGNTVGTDTVSGTGNGAAQTLTIYGQVPNQTTPAPDTYTDTVTVTVTY